MTPEGWVRRKVASFAVRSKVVNVTGEALPPLSVTKGRGVVLQSEKYNKQISPDYVVFDVDETVDKRFMNYLFRWSDTTPAYEAVAETGNQFGKRRRVYWSVFEQLDFLLPPIREQQQIAAILLAMDKAIEATQAVIDQIQVVKKAMMTELLTRGMPERHGRFRNTSIGTIPDSWLIKPCGELFQVQLGKMMGPEARRGADQLPYLRNENVYWHRLDLSDVATMSFDLREREKFRLQQGDLLACEGRHIGRCALWNNELDECYYQKALHRIRSKSDEITTGYMQYFMMLRFRYQSDLVAEANTTSTIPHLPLERLLALPVWYPPREEQDEIVSILVSLNEREAAESAYLETLHQVKAALMSVLLTGELRVPLDEDA